MSDKYVAEKDIKKTIKLENLHNEEEYLEIELHEEGCMLKDSKTNSNELVWVPISMYKELIDTLTSRIK